MEVSCLGSAPGEDIGQFFPQVQFYNAPVVIVVVITITIVVVVIIIILKATNHNLHPSDVSDSTYTYTL